MKLEKETYKALVKYLLQHGYPPESLAVEYQLGKYRVDLAVIDPESKVPLALFEIKQQKTPLTLKTGKEQLKRFLSYLDTKSIPTYLVFTKKGTPAFEIQRIQLEETQISVEETGFKSELEMDFDTIQNITRSAITAETTNRRKRTIDILKWQCVFIISILLVLLILDALNIILISTEHLTIGGVIIALSLIPYASKLKFLGFEFERRKSQDKTKTS